ncbi:MAG: glutamine synthetase beta-grasp domain-containing protein, partial [Ignavibacteriales bacterium]|nr:glutamine synthetase beta-grasp domain-containing protein [Ignavibacteriales bacterium]
MATATKSKAPSGVEKVFAMMKDRDVKVIDLKFCDMLGQWQHFSVTTSEFSEEVFEDGIGFDGSSIRGFQKIHESDMLLFPDPASAFVDPFTAVPTLSLTCDVADPITRESYSRDPRHVARKAEMYLKSTGIADTAYFGPEPEFFILDNIRFDQSYHCGYYYI